MPKQHDQGSIFSRLFGNENQQLHTPIGEDNWARIALQTTAAQRAVDAPASAAQPVDVVSVVKPADPLMRMSVALNLANAAPAGGYKIACRGNTLLYADSTNGSDRLLVVYADTEGDTSQPNRSMIPGRLRRERYFNFLYFTWTVTAGATATIEIYDDPDGALYIQD